MCFPFTYVIVSYCISLFYLLLFTSFSFLVDISKHHHEFRLSFQSNYTLYSYSPASPLTGSVLFSPCPFVVLNSPTNTVRFLSVSLQDLPSGLSPSLAKYHIQCHVTLFLPACSPPCIFHHVVSSFLSLQDYSKHGKSDNQCPVLSHRSTVQPVTQSACQFLVSGSTVQLHCLLTACKFFSSGHDVLLVFIRRLTVL